jgi:two-component system NtrC family sensor kinase
MSASNVQNSGLGEHTHLTALLAELSHILAKQSTVPDLVQCVADTIVQRLKDIALVKVWLLNSEQTMLELQAKSGRIRDSVDLPDRISLGISIVGLIAQNRIPYLTNHLSQDICFSSQDWIKQEKLVAFAGYPLIIEGRLIGVMVFFSRQPISDAISNLLQWVMSSLVVAIDRILARAELLSRRETLLFRLANQIRNSLDLDKILGTAVQEIRQLLHIDRCHFIWCWTSAPSSTAQDPIQPILCITHESKQTGLPSLVGECSPEQVAVLASKILSLQPFQFDITQEQLEPEMMDLMQAWGMQSELLMPLETRSGHLGAIVCGHCQDIHLWSKSDIELLQAVTDQLAIAIDQAELYAQTRAAALAAQTQTEQLSAALTHLRQTQSQLIQSEKMSSLGQLVAGIAHEINNPVTFVSGNLAHANGYFQDLVNLLKLYETHYPNPVIEVQQCIEELDLDFVVTDLQNVLNSMRIGADRIYKIVLSLRNFSRLDEAEVKAVDLHEGIDSTLLILQNRLKPQGHRPGIEIVKEYGKLPLVNCYASQLNQVFMNLISNAIDAFEDAASPHVITIQTECLPSQDPGNPLIPAWVVIKIGDNGIGMKDEVRQRIFDPFYTTKPVGHGTGLGLSISHQIVVEKHKGRLSCQSQLGDGTTFVIEIPCYETEFTDAAEPSCSRS